MEQLLQRYIRGEVSEEERLKVASWLDESAENMREFLALRKLYDLSLWQSDTNEKYSVRKRHFSIQKITIELLKIAAIFLVGFWGSKQLLTQQPDKAQMQTIHVPAGQRAEVTLADGTHVWLNSRSTLRFPEQFSTNARNVELDGEGYFSVQHNEESPFIVQTPKYAIQVLGTEFNVKAYPEDELITTTLTSGKVAVQLPEEKYMLRPNQELVYNTVDKRATVQGVSDNSTNWRDGSLIFTELTMSEIFKELERRFDVKFSYSQNSLPDDRYSIKFTNKEELPQILNVFQDVTGDGFTYKTNDKTIIITIK